jgi:hypothetical protein
MAALATKTQSQNIFAKLKQRPANKVRYKKGRGGQEGRLTDVHWTGMLRLRRKEPNMVVGSVWYLPVPGLLGKPQKHGRAHLVCAVHES